MSETTNKNPAIVVEARDLTKVYRSGKRVVNALSGVSFSVESGKFVAIMGASGSGKSTLLHLLAGLTEPTSGTIKINGADIAALSDSAKTKFRRKNIGIVFQAFNLIPTLTADENIMLPARLEGITVSKNRLDEILNFLEIQERRHHRPDSLSGGEQQRVAIGRALLMEPSIILADEPSGNLDSENSQRLCKFLRDSCDMEKRTIIVVTHDNSVADWADQCLNIKDGKIVQETAKEVHV